MTSVFLQWFGRVNGACVARRYDGACGDSRFPMEVRNLAEKIEVTVAEAETRFEELIDAALRGADVVILQDGRQVLSVVPYRGDTADGADDL